METFDLDSFISMTTQLFLIMDAVGVIPVILTLIKGLDVKRQKAVIIREMVIALIVMLIAQFTGEYILNFLQISKSTLYFSGAIVLFFTALSIIFPAHATSNTSANTQDKEPFIVPIAVPLIAGSGVIAQIMIYAQQLPSVTLLTSSLLVAWLLSTIILYFLPQLSKLLGKAGIAACERLMGLLVLMLAVNSFLNGLIYYFKGN
ncbi:MAG: rane protein MarC family [Chlamydiales bacterium]|jgi:multiple antibiotic resistance protein|nr:rane protein MarC family [Chlamydiales bacterium]